MHKSSGNDWNLFDGKMSPDSNQGANIIHSMSNHMRIAENAHKRKLQSKYMESNLNKADSRYKTLYQDGSLFNMIKGHTPSLSSMPLKGLKETITNTSQFSSGISRLFKK